MSASRPPLILLSGHRTGSSAVMGVLALSGLHLGEVLPPTIDNPKGYFENALVVAENNRLLGRLDRDWTSPPHRMTHEIDVDHREAALADCQGEDGQPWAVKDPRLLFTLPAWLPSIDGAVLVGVDRPVESVARSIHRRDGIDANIATQIAEAHSRRLWSLAEELDFPIVGFGEATMKMQIETIAAELGLSLPPGAVDSVIDPSLIHHVSSGGADKPISKSGSVTTCARTVIERAFRRCEAKPGIDLRTDQGPVFQQRTRELLRLCVGDTKPGRVAVVADPLARVPALDVPTLDRLTIEELSLVDDRRFSHVVGPHALDLIPPEEMASFLHAVERVVDRGGAVAVSGAVAEDGRGPSSMGVEPLDVLADRMRPPYLHRRDELELLLADTSWHLLDARLTHGGRTQLRLGRDPRLRASGALTPWELRTHVTELESDIRHANETIRDLEKKTGVLERGMAEATRVAETKERELESIRDRLARASTQTAEQRERGDRHAANASKLQETVNDQHTQIATLEKRQRKLSRDLTSITSRYERLAGRRIVRFALGLAGLTAPLFRAVRKLRKRRAKPKSVPAATSAGQVPAKPTLVVRRKSATEIVSEIRSARPGGGRTTGPLVSIIVLTRNGAHHLERLLPRLRSTTYRSFELVVIDNQSTDDTGSVLGHEWGFPVRVVRNEHNASFSEGNNQALDMAEGDFLLFMNNDLEPINDGWLGVMVDALGADPSPSAVGALLVYPERGEPETDMTVQHRGIGFGFRNGAPHAFNLPYADPTDPALVATVEVPAVTAAVLLCRRNTFEAVGGFTTGYVYGTEDVDLCLKLKPLGPIVMAGGAAIFHHESATQKTVVPDVIRINRIGNWQRFAETWGPTLTRSVLRDRISATGSWTGRATRTVAITVTSNDPAAGFGDYYTAHELGDAMAASGWEVRYAQRVGDEWYDIDHDVDVMIVLLDAFDVSQVPTGVYTIAWVRNWVDRWIEQPWFEQFDLCVCSSSSAAAEVAERSRFDPPVIPLAANPERFSPGPPNPTFSSDYTFTGSNWGRGRDIVPLLDVRAGEQFLLFGANWENEPRVRRYWRGLLDYDLIPDLYRSTKIVLDDTAVHTIEHGFVNSRVFDALAAGALVVTNNTIGSQELFDGLLPVYSDRASLRKILDRYLGDDEEREALASRLRQIVLDRHTYGRRATEFVDVAIQDIERPRVAVKIGAPRLETAHTWGDFHYANALVRSFAALGWNGEVHLLPEWDDPDKQDTDVVIHLRGLTTYAPKPSHVNVMWLISHPDDVSNEEYEKYDLVCVASKPLAERLQREIETPVVFLPQATDASRFGTAEPNGDLSCEVLFVGNSRKQRRDAVDWAIAVDAPLTMYGSDWDELIPDGYVKGTYFPNEDLGNLYASADIVLNDHWPDMRTAGIVSNRILDALAAGALVLSDRVEGLEEMLGDTVPTFSSQDELGSLIREYLADATGRRALAQRGRQTVLEHHTFDRRAAELVELIAPLLKGRPRDCDGRTF